MNNKFRLICGEPLILINEQCNEVVQGLDVKLPVRVATTCDILLYGLQSIDYTYVLEGDRVLVKDQICESENGVYIVRPGVWERSEDPVNYGMTVFVCNGVVNAGNGFVLMTRDPIRIGSTSLLFSQFFTHRGVS